ncbi:hypothetical protein VHEMI08103 [[Torrubiella] hemipterigena]|uniref:Uncharacterized protein n=1 Tax=[Torrubiella] hemipterigena TaxID=1531966 RepID=A0A0A1T5K4_9HYPO|nr:hypothetical protein VHEMI08103 [[Torrubiella] hemipterigena]
MCKVTAYKAECLWCNMQQIMRLGQTFCDKRVYVPQTDSCHCDDAVIVDDEDSKPLNSQEKVVVHRRFRGTQGCRHLGEIPFDEEDFVNMVPTAEWNDICKSIGWTFRNPAGN